MAGKARTTERTEQQQGETGDEAKTGTGEAQGGGTLTEEVRPSQPAEGAAAGPRSATVNLPFVTAQFRAPDLHVPTRDELAGAARGARSLVPSKGAALFFGGLVVTAVAGAIEWPVAAAIGVGTALASRGAADPTPRGGAASVPAQAEARGAEGEEQGASAPAGSGSEPGSGR